MIDKREGARAREREISFVIEFVKYYLKHSLSAVNGDIVMFVLLTLIFTETSITLTTTGTATATAQPAQASPVPSPPLFPSPAHSAPTSDAPSTIAHSTSPLRPARPADTRAASMPTSAGSAVGAGGPWRRRCCGDG